MTAVIKEFYWTVTRLVGLGAIHGKEIALTKRGLSLTFALFYFPVFVILYACRVRFISVACLQLERIGHFTIDIDCYIKDQRLKNTRVRTALLCVGCKVNEALLKHWSRYLFIIRSRVALVFIKPLLTYRPIVADMMNYTMVGYKAWDPSEPFEARMGWSRAFQIQADWGHRLPLLRLSDEELRDGWDRLKTLGVPEGAWFVCVHAREGGYAPQDEWSQSYRNVDIDDFIPAMKEITDRGGWCIRMGDSTMKRLPPLTNVVDYVHTNVKSDWMDLFLCANCRFFLGTTSGLFGLASVFGRPSALTNIEPYSAFSIFLGDITLLRPQFDRNGREMHWADIYASRVSHFRHIEEFRSEGITQRPNSIDDIVDLTVQLLQETNGEKREVDAEDDRLQAAFKSLMGPEHFAWKSSSRLGSAFLKKNRQLLKARESDDAV